jgi:hypothetical protein
MGVVNWLRGAGGKVLGGLNWLGQTVGKPLLGLAKQIPKVGDIVRGAEPALNAISKTSQWAEDSLKGVQPEKRRKLPTGEEAKAGFDSAVRTGKTIASVVANRGFSGM